MRTNSVKRLVILLIIFIVSPSILFSTAPPSARRQILGIRYWTAPDHTRVVLDMSSESKYKVKFFDNPPRVAINIYGGKIWQQKPSLFLVHLLVPGVQN